MAAVPLAIEADVSELDPADPDAVRVVHGHAESLGASANVHDRVQNRGRHPFRHPCV